MEGLNVTAEGFLAAVLESVAQPIWAVDAAGLIRFVNPAAIAALGYDEPEELLGRFVHATVHYQRPDGTPYPAHECPMRLPNLTGETVSSELDWFIRRDGSMFPVSYVSVPIELPDGRGGVVAFSDIEHRLNAERALREHDAVLAAREGSLRRIATLVAAGAASPEVFAAIAREVAQALGLALVVLWRVEPDRPTTVLGSWSDRPHPFEVGSAWPMDAGTATRLLPRLDRPTRIEDFGAVGGAIATSIHAIGIGAGTGAAIVVDGELWGVMGGGVPANTALPEQIEERLAEFTELVATTISNTMSREKLARMADEQAALRRVATLIAREAPAAEVFTAVAEELGRLLDVAATRLIRFEDDRTGTVVSSWGCEDEVPVGTSVRLGGSNVISEVARTGRPSRIDDYSQATGPAAELGRRLHALGAVGGPVVVGGRLWGAMLVSSRHPEPMPAGTEEWIEQFAELVATAISNLEAWSHLAASRARIVAAADEERRRVVRDLHDGAQQRMVHTIITLKLAQRAVSNADANALDVVTEALAHAEQATGELRELAHGILPAALTQGGLRSGVDALASRMPVPVDHDVTVDRLPAGIEATAYFVVAEALTNVAKHAHARRATVTAHVDAGTLHIRVRDNGVGGARPEGSGLLGLGDRLAALDGSFWVESPLDGGTLLAADIPV